jgi:hypothetical protein
MKKTLWLWLFVSGCSLFEDVSTVRFVEVSDVGQDSGHDANGVEDVGDSGWPDLDASADTDAPDVQTEDVADLGDADAADASEDTDVPEDMAAPQDMAHDGPEDVGSDATLCTLPEILRDGLCIEAGTVCAAPAEDLIPGVCDPVAQTGCQAGTFCTIRFSSGVFERVCATVPTATVGEGEACNMIPCEAGFGCFAGTCRRYCDVDNAAGCRANEACAPPLAPTHGIGFCDEDCTLD